MAQNEKKRPNKASKRVQTAPISSKENTLWMTGFVLLALGVFATISVISHYFNWAADKSALMLDEELYRTKATFGNICSGVGARVAYLFVDCSFGVFGVIIPIVLMVVGWRIFRKKPLNLNHFALSAALLLIMGSVTLGVFDIHTNFSLDMGGNFGVMCADDLSSAIGAGLYLVLIVGWILTGVFINRNFIKTVNKASDKMVDGSEKILAGVKDMVKKGRGKGEVSDEDEALDEGDDIAAQEDDVTEEEPHAEPAQPEVVTPKPEEEEFVVIPRATDGERPLTINEYIAQQREAAKQASEAGEATKSVASEQADDYGFTVVANSDEKASEVNVDKLLHVDDEDKSTNLEDNEFFIVSNDDAKQSQEQRVEPKSNTNVVTDEDDDMFVVTSREDSAPKAEDDALVINVFENKPRVVEADMVDDKELYDPLRDLEHYKKPYVSLLEDYKSSSRVSDAEIYDNKCRIQETLKYFGIPIVNINATVGPTVTLYEIKQAQGVKISKIQSLEKDMAQSLRAQGIRIIAPIPGKGTIGIEVPNREKQIVSMYTSICSNEFQSAKMELPIVIGRTIQNENYTFDLAKLPHLLVAGATGQGKSVGLNAIITSLLFTKHPAQLKFVMIDPKMVEFSVYNKLEHHFLAKMESEDESIITEPKKAVCVLNSLVEEMGRRLELLKMATARNIVEYNDKFTSRRLNPQKGHRFLPYIVVIIDEFADLIMTAKEVEVPVMRLAQKARAVGIHLIVATQRPDVKVITGGIKANFPARIAFRVMSMTDSRTIIDQPGANQLIGRGDMLFSKDGELTRIQCALVETNEVERMVDFISKQQGYTEAYPLPDFDMESGSDGVAGGDGDSGAPMKYDVLFGEVARAAVTTGMISTSSIQRNYEVGFNRAGRIMLQLERAGIVGPQVGAKPREIKFYDLPSLEAKLQSLGVF